MIARYEVLAAVLMKFRVIWNKTPCRLVYMLGTDSTYSGQFKAVTPED